MVLSQAADDGLLVANPALAMRSYLRRGDELRELEIDPFTKHEADLLIATAAEHFPEGHAWVLTARLPMRIGELLALQWGDS